MSALSDDLEALATELITEYGQSCSFSRTSGGTFDPTAGENTGASTSTWTGVCVPEDYKRYEINETTIKENDIKLLVNKTDTEPKAGDTVTVSTVVYRVIEAKKQVLNGANVMYELQVRI